MCYEPSPAFPVPSWSHGRTDFQDAFEDIQKKLDVVAALDKYDTSSFSIDITSSTESLWQTSHTAKVQNATRPGDQHVDSSSMYMIASITKAFTTLGILYQHDAGNVSLDDPVSNYIAELDGPKAGSMPWHDISLRTLASQLSGLPREFAQSDLINADFDPVSIGLPPRERAGLPQCDEYDHYAHACNRTDLIDTLMRHRPLFAPHQKSTYSNVNFVLLGLVLENVTGLPYIEYINQAIFEPLGMKTSTFSTPSDEHAVLPVGDNYWVSMTSRLSPLRICFDRTSLILAGHRDGRAEP